MPRDSNGNTNPLPGTIVQTGDTILPSQHNPALVDLYAMMTQSLSRDGQGGMRANLALNGFQVTGLGSATQPGNAVPLSQFQSGTPVGAVVDYAGSNAPATWMFCYGQAISRTTYPVLFAAIGTTYGTGNGSTTFNLPDLRGRVIAGKDNMGGSFSGRLDMLAGQQNVLGGSGGADRHTLIISQIPAHNHGGETSSSGVHEHVGGSVPTGAAGAGAGLVQSVGNIGPAIPNFRTNASPSHTHGIPAQGDSQSHNNTQPTFILNKIIKVSY